MYKKTIKFEDYDGNQREEDFYFNLNKAECAEMELSTVGGLSAYIERIVKTDNRPQLIAIFKELIHKAYGVKSADGRRFIKNEEVWEEFAQTEAYSNLFMELASDSDAAAAFINGIVPKVQAEQPTTTPLRTV